MSPVTNKKKTLAVGAVGVAVASMIGAGLLLGPAAGQGSNSGADAAVTTTPAPVLTESIRRSDLAETKEETASVGYGDAWAIPTDADGIVTERHDRDTVVEPGQALIWLDGKPVFLAKGSAPMYRTLELQGTTKAKHVQGDDVRQLQEFLIAQGFDDSERLEADGIFGVGTRRAMKAWQKDLGLEQTGRVDRTRLVFNPTSVRIESAPRLGTRFERLEVTDAAQRLTAQFDNKSRPFVPVGGTVDLESGVDSSTGTIVKTESTVGDDGTQRLEVEIEPDQPLAPGTERVKVTATRTMATDALVVPVRAVLALAGGGYGLEVSTGSGLELRAVEIEQVVDDLAEISGDFSEGDEVVVPNDQFGTEE